MSNAVVMVGTDFSTGAKAALKNARNLAGRLGTGLSVVHIFDPLDGETAEPSSAAHQWLAECELTLSELTWRPGVAWLELIRWARELDAAVVVLGRHGRTGGQPLELGNTAARVGLTAHCPVMLVAESAVGRPTSRFWHEPAEPRQLIS